jgi:uncharacterized glyoxalase superfamily protein PhnB
LALTLRIELFPDDLDRFVNFYVDVLRFEIVEDQGTELVFDTDDVETERDAVVAAGWPLADDLQKRPWGVTDFRLFDPDGYYIRITARSYPR